MNELEKILAEKLTENGDKSYTTTGNNLIDLIFMADFFTKNLNAVHIGNSDKEKLFAMYMRDPRFGQGRRDLGRRLMKLAGVNTNDTILAGRYDDLWHNPTKENMDRLYAEVKSGNELAKKWMPRLTGKDKKLAKAIAKAWGLSEKEYRKLIKCDNTTEYKLSYAELDTTGNTPLNEAFNEHNYTHPLVDTIDFEKVPSLAMTKYMRAFATRPDTAERFAEYVGAVKENKAKVNTATATVHDAYKTVMREDTEKVADIADTLGNKIIEQETDGISLSCICVLDTSYSMGTLNSNSSLCAKATSVAHALATHSTYAPNQVISFSSHPQLMTIKGNTLKAQYQSMFTGDCSSTDLGAVFKILMNLKTFPEYVIVMSDMEFNKGSMWNYEEWHKLVEETGAKTKLIWWNFNDRNNTSPEYDENGNIYLSGYNIQALLQLPGIIDMDAYIDKLLSDYAKKINK